MAKAQYVGVGGVARKVKQPYIGIGGVARKVKNGYIGADGVARQFFSGGKSASEYAVGDSVYFKVNSVKTQFIVVHQGIPNTSSYNADCTGTWVLMKNLYAKTTYSGLDKMNYPSSKLHDYMQNTFLPLLSSTARNTIKEVHLPYHSGAIVTKVFALSRREIGESEYTANVSKEGYPLAYFPSNDDAYDSRRKATLNGTATAWWTRSIQTFYTEKAIRVASTGSGTTWKDGTDEYGVRPAFILPFDATFNPLTNEFLE